MATSNSDEAFNIPPGGLYSGTPSVKVIVVICGVLMTLIATFTVMANSTVLVATARTFLIEGQLGRYATVNHHGSIVTRQLMISLTFAGLAVGGFLMPVSLVHFLANGRWSMGFLGCAVRMYGVYLLCSVLNFHILFMAIDMYISICKPLVYRLLTATAGYVMIVVGWMVPSLIVCLWIILRQDVLVSECMDNTKKNINTCQKEDIFIFFFGCLSFVLFLSVCILYRCVLNAVNNFVNRNHKAALTVLHMKSSISNNSTITLYTIPLPVSTDSRITFSEENTTLCDRSLAADSRSTQCSRKRYGIKKTQRSRLKSYRVIGMTLVCVTVCCVPTWVLALLDESCAVKLPLWAWKAISWLGYISCTLNPVVYCWNKTIYRSVKTLICGVCS